MQRISTLRALKDNTKFRENLSGSIWGLSFEAVSLVGTLLSFMLLGRTLGAAGYGEYATLYAIVGPLMALAASGVVLALLQHVVRDREPLEETVRSCLSLTVILGSVLTVVGAAIAFEVVGSLGAVAIFSILLVEFIATPMLGVAATTVQSQAAYAASVKVRMTLAVGRVIVLLGLFFMDNLTVQSLATSQLALSLVLASVALFRVGKLYSIKAFPGRVRMKHLSSNVNYSVAISADSVANDGDKVVLAANNYVVDTGLYAAAYRIIGLGQIPVGVLVSMSHKRFLQHDESRQREHLDLAVRFSLIAGAYGILFGIAVYFAAPLFPLVMGSEFEGSVVMLQWLAPIVFFRAIGIFSLNGLMGLGRVLLRTVIVTLNALVGVVLFLLLIPSRGWEGAVLASLITEAAQVVMTWTALLVCQRISDRQVRNLEFELADS